MHQQGEAQVTEAQQKTSITGRELGPGLAVTQSLALVA
jgi:hypothetical protein